MSDKDNKKFSFITIKILFVDSFNKYIRWKQKRSKKLNDKNDDESGDIYE